MRQNTGVISMGLAPAARMPLRARLRLLAEPTLGVGSFLDHARAVSPDPSAPFLLAQHAEGTEEDGLERLSLDRLTEIRDAYASWYHEAGVRKGDPVGVYAGEGIDAFLHFLALSSLGAIAALVNGRMKPAVAAEYLGRIGVYGLVGTAGGIDRLRASGGLPKNLAFEKDLRSFPRSRTARPSLPGVFPYRHGEDDLVMLCHTSGTTGPPKAVTFGHRQFFRGKRHRLVSFPDAGANRMLSALPQTHSAGISYLMTATLLGLPTLVMADSSGEAVHDAAGWFRPTLVVAFPQTYAELAGLDLSPSAVGAVHTWINTGDSAHEAHIKALIRHGRRPGRRVPRAPAPGSSTGSAPPRWAWRCSARSASRSGRTTTGASASRSRWWNAPPCSTRTAGSSAPAGRAWCVISPTRTPGYWGNTELTGKSSVSGFWLTGDVVYRDRRGRFFHLDRVPDVIDTAEGPVYSLPIEEAILLGRPEVADCAVVAVDAPPPLGKQVPFATVLLKPGAKAPADLLGSLNDVLRARGLTALSAAVVATEPEHFPTGATGKVLKRSLREHFADVLVRPAPGAEESST